MKRRAYNRLLLPDGTEQLNVIVTFSDEGEPLSWQPLRGEEPFVEWAGGSYTL
ncbi:MAG: hypothetical protein LUI09_00230 [Prevotellaceae bacterium]|nr:hypothetical protein [Prevotellaceae bacterium]